MLFGLSQSVHAIPLGHSGYSRQPRTNNRNKSVIWKIRVFVSWVFLNASVWMQDSYLHVYDMYKMWLFFDVMVIMTNIHVIPRLKDCLMDLWHTHVCNSPRIYCFVIHLRLNLQKPFIRKKYQRLCSLPNCLQNSRKNMATAPCQT